MHIPYPETSLSARRFIAVERLQPTARGADEQDEGPKKFPPVDTLSVAGYLRSGMGKGLATFFIESEEHVDQSTSSSDSVPSYPIVYPFAQELQELRTVLERDPSRVTLGLGLVGTSEPSAVEPKQVSTMTIEGHLKQLTLQCHLVFEGPSLALARSFKVLHLLNLTLLDPVPSGSNIKAAGDIKVSLRYCYQDLEPWLYVALYPPSSKPNKEPYCKHFCMMCFTYCSSLSSSLTMVVDSVYSKI